MKTMKEVVRGFSPERQNKIAERTAQLIAGEMTLRDLRQAHARTQVSIANTLHISQDGVSRLEQRSDVLISTLRGYVRALGGKLSLVAEFPESDPVVISGFREIAGHPKPSRATKKRRRRVLTPILDRKRTRKRAGLTV
jgi:hypothetical protein